MESNLKYSNNDKAIDQDGLINIEEKEIKLNDVPVVSIIPKDNTVPTIITQSEDLIQSQVFLSKSRMHELDFIWKFKLIKKKLHETFMEYEFIPGRENQFIHVALLNIFYPSSMSSSLIYIFQNGDEINEEDFKERVELIKYRYIYNIQSYESQSKFEVENKTITESSICSDKNSDNFYLLPENQSKHSEKSHSKQSDVEAVKNGLKGESQRQYETVNSKGQIFFENINKTEDNNNPTSFLEGLINYDLHIIFTIVNETSISCSLKSIRSGILIGREMQLTSNAIKDIEEEAIIIIETRRLKNFPEAKGFTGLVNEGMTCYMNSMIQALNFLGYFKRGVFQMPFESTNTIAYSFQRLFYELTFENELATTTQLIESFGWGRDNIFVQHDVQEFNMLLSDLMEKKMQGTKAEGSFKYLFEGKTKNTIECIDYAYSTEKEETFNDLQLNVKGCRNIYDSFNQFTEPELMENEDMYMVEGHGKEKAKKTFKFLSLPPVLILQLKRFDYNIRKDQMEKINDSYEFGSTLDMSKYLPAEQRNDSNYVLFSILVHRGNADAGHYYSYIRPSIEKNEWYCFDDECVSQTDSYEVFNKNFGGTQRMFRHIQNGEIREYCMTSDVSAYILIYIKESQAATILKPITFEEISPEIIQAIINEKSLEKYEMQMRERRKSNMDIYLLSKETLKEYKGIGLSHGNSNVTMNLITYDDPNYMTIINIPKCQKVKDLYLLLVAQFNCHINDIELFLFCMKTPNKVTKRNDYSMHYLSDAYYDEELSLIITKTGNPKTIKRVYIYIHINRTKKNIAPLIMQKDYNLPEITVNYSNQTNFTYYLPSPIKFQLNTQINQSPNENQMNVLNKNDKKLVIIKQFNFTEKTLSIHDMILIENNNFEPLRQLTDITLAYYKKSIHNKKDEESQQELGICYFIEIASGFAIYQDEFYDSAPKTINDHKKDDNDNIQMKESKEENLIDYDPITLAFENNPYLDLIYDLKKLFKSNEDSFIIIPYVYYKDTKIIPLSVNMLDIYYEYKNLVFLSCVYNNPNKSITPQRLRNKTFYYLTDSYEIIRQKVFDSIPKEVIYDLLIQERETENAYIYDSEEQLIPLRDYCNNMTCDNFIISQKITTNSKNFAEVNEFPLVTYIGMMKNPAELELVILTLPQEDEEEEDDNAESKNEENRSDIATYNPLKSFDIVLYDVHNNPIVDIELHISKLQSIPKEVLTYIYDPILKKFYGNDYNLNDYQMFINFPLKYYSFNVINDVNLEMDEINIKFQNTFKFNIMPLNMTNNQFRISVAFQMSKSIPLCEPLIMLESIDITVLEMKNAIYERIQRINKLTNQPAIVCNDITKLKFYIYTIIQNNPSKEMLLINSKNNEKLLSFSKQLNYCQILVEFLPNNTDDKNQSDSLKL